MHRLGEFVVKHTKIIIIVFLVLMVLGGFMAMGVQVNLDNIGYLPDTSESKQTVSVLEKEFNMRGTATLMVKETDPLKVLALKEHIDSFPEVNQVVWLDTRVDMKTPVTSWDTRLTDLFYRDGYAKFTILFSDKNDSTVTHEAVRKIEALVGDNGYFIGTAVTSTHSNERINREVPLYSAVAVVLILIILFLSTTSWLEPFLFLLSIGVSIIINMGLNLLGGEVSQITFSAASILQLAVSMDYSVFMLHRFHERRAAGEDVKEAMVNAMTLSTAPVLASALTTVAGFAALLLMDFGIGGDLGIVLARGVALSLLSVLTFLPALIIITDKWVEKWTHRDLNISLKKVSRFSVKARYPLTILLLLLAVVFFRAQGNIDYYYGMDNVLPIADKALTDDKKIREIYGNTEQSTILVPLGHQVEEEAMVEDLLKIPGVNSVDGLGVGATSRLPKELLPASLVEQFHSDKTSMLILTTSTGGSETDEAFVMVDLVREAVQKHIPEAIIGGGSFTFKDLKDVTDADQGKVAIASAILIFFIIMISFQSIGIPLIAVFLIETAIWINVGLVYFMQTPMSFISFIIIGAIQLGATVDYAILFVSRYKENYALLPPIEAARQTVSDTAKSILTSSFILISATMSVYLIATIRTGAELCLFIGRGAFISTVMVLLVLPGMLVLFDPLIRRTSLRWPKKVEFIDKKTKTKVLKST